MRRRNSRFRQQVAPSSLLPGRRWPSGARSDVVCGPGSDRRRFCQAFSEERFCRRSSPTALRSPFFNGMLATGKHFDWKIRCALQHSPGEGMREWVCYSPLPVRFQNQGAGVPPPRISSTLRQDSGASPVPFNRSSHSGIIK